MLICVACLPCLSCAPAEPWRAPAWLPALAPGLFPVHLLSLGVYSLDALMSCSPAEPWCAPAWLPALAPDLTC
eukprot:1143810-Pelagomonas_calceolata.AAC.1